MQSLHSERWFVNSDGGSNVHCSAIKMSLHRAISTALKLSAIPSSNCLHVIERGLHKSRMIP